MGRDHSPAFGQACPGLALPPTNDFAVIGSLELKVHAAEIAAEGGDVEPGDCASEVHCGAGISERLNLVDSVQIFCRSKADDMGRGPEETLHRLDVVGDKGLFILRIKLCQFGDGSRVVDEHSFIHLEELDSGQHGFWNRGADGDDRFVDDLAEAKIHGNAAEQVGVNLRHAGAD